MAEDKKSFVLYADQITIVKKLIEQDRKNTTNYTGELFLHILEYVNDLNPVPVNFIVDMAFEPIKLQLKRDLKAWEETKEIKSNNGKLGNLKRWNKDLYDEVLNKKITIEQAEKIAENRKISQGDNIVSPPIAKIAVNDIVNVTDTDTVTVTNNSFADKSASSYLEESNSKDLKRKKVAPKKENETKHWKAFVDTWFKFYKSKFIIDPTFNAVQGKILKSIVDRFEMLSEAKDKSESIDFTWPEDRAIRVFLKFLENAWQDKWLQEHFLLKNLLSNFDSIISKKSTENGKQPTNTSKTAYRFNLESAIEQANSSGN